MTGSLGRTRVANGLRHRVGLVRGVLAGSRREVDRGSNVKFGRGVRWRLEPGCEVVIGDDCEVDDGATIAVARGGRLLIGDGVFIGHHAALTVRELVEVGRGTFLAEYVTVRDHDHDPAHPPSSGPSLAAPITIGSECWLASKVTVTRGVVIGDRVVVGANAVVTRDLPGGVLAAGVPARVIRDVGP